VHVLRAVEHVSEYEEEDDRDNKHGRERDNGGETGPGAPERSINLCAVKGAEGKTTGNPGESCDAGCNVWTPRWAVT
jgi:hypothetical protein